MSLQGRSHISKGKPCQDSSHASRLNETWSTAIIADGVGSCKYSDQSSATAVAEVLSIFQDHLDYLDDKKKILDLIKKSFQSAYNAVAKLSIDQGNPLDEYDTTLSVVLYDGDDVYYGHSGDGGIIGLHDDGKYEKITEPQKGDDGISVLPLRSIDTWVFGSTKNISSVLLATDGVYDTFFPYLIQMNKVKIYVPLISYYMDNNDINISEENEASIGAEIEQFLLSDSCSSITDDMTVAVLINSEKMPKRMPDWYYEEPDWEKLKDAMSTKMYPPEKPIRPPVIRSKQHKKRNKRWSHKKR